MEKKMENMEEEETLSGDMTLKMIASRLNVDLETVRRRVETLTPSRRRGWEITLEDILQMEK